MGKLIFLLIGAGGHARVVLDAARLSGMENAVQVADDDVRKHGIAFEDCGVVVPLSPLNPALSVFHVAIGHNCVREQISGRLAAMGLRPMTIIHPRACVARSAQLDEGCFVAAQAVVAPQARLGRSVIVNHGAVVDHECQVGDFSHIAPNATLAGNVRIGRRVLIGAGANVLPGVTIADDCVVGAGAVVLSDLAAGATSVGVPGRIKNLRGAD